MRLPNRVPMKSAIFIALLAGLPLPGWARAEPWTFVRSVGGLAVDTPRKSERGWVLPVRANVSGLVTVTEKPTLLNSALVCKGTEAKVEGSNIYITIVSGLTDRKTSPWCPDAQLGKIAPGKYVVFYRSPNSQPVRLGEVDVGSSDLRVEVVAQLKRTGSDVSKVHQFDFYFYMPTESRSKGIAEELQKQGLQTRISPSAKGFSWLCLASGAFVPDSPKLREFGELFLKLSTKHGGEFDGWEAEIVR